MSKTVFYPKPKMRYRHYKGGLYEVITMATHSETGEPMVVYKSTLFGSVYTRPLSMWFEEVEVDGEKVRRFSRKDVWKDAEDLMKCD